MTTSLIIATYNRPDALALVLMSLDAQTVMPHEIIIADDGSDDRTGAVVKQYQQQSRVPVKHVWHPDEGFRLSAIRNKAIAAATADYIIQIDGDVLMHRYFIEDHIRFAKPNSFVRASRIYLNEKLTNQKLLQRNAKISLMQEGVSNKTSALHVPWLWPVFATGYKNKGMERFEIHGCNMAFWRKDAVKVNGYNEDFVGWGYEDKEFVARLLAAGCEKRFIKLGAIVYHLHHAENSRQREPENAVILKETISLGQSYCANGIHQYLHHHASTHA